MDNDELGSAYRALTRLACPFEKAILTNQCGCSQAERFCIAEREGVRCRSEQAQTLCVELKRLLSERSRFALKTTATPSALPHAKSMRLQIGGLRGLQTALTPEAPAPSFVSDIRATIEAAMTEFGSLEALPFARIVQQIAAYRGRRSRRRGD